MNISKHITESEKEPALMNKPIIALLYDFDKTLSPRDMQEYGFIEGIGMTPEAFWGKCEEMSKRAEVDSILAYMYNMLREVYLAVFTHGWQPN